VCDPIDLYSRYLKTLIVHITKQVNSILYYLEVKTRLVLQEGAQGKKRGQTRLLVTPSWCKGGVFGGAKEKYLSPSHLQLHFQPPLSTSLILIMSQQEYAETQPEEQESLPAPNRWKSAWTNNKGIFLIILAQGVGSTMDAIVRFLQQGGHGMHPFQVSLQLT